MRRGLLVKLNSLLNASVRIFESVFSSKLSIIDPNSRELLFEKEMLLNFIKIKKVLPTLLNHGKLKFLK